MIASAILLGVVTAVTAAITAGQQHAYEAQQRIAAVLAAEALLGRVVAGDYDSIATWDGYTEPVGTMRDESAQPYPDSFDSIGRTVIVEAAFEEISPPDVNVRGRTVRVQSFDDSGRILAEIVRFVPEPRERTLP